MTKFIKKKIQKLMGIRRIYSKLFIESVLNNYNMSVAVKCFRPYDKEALKNIMECAGCPPAPDPQCPPMCIPPAPVTRCCPLQQGTSICGDTSVGSAPSSQARCTGATSQQMASCCPSTSIINSGGFFYTAAKKC